MEINTACAFVWPEKVAGWLWSTHKDGITEWKKSGWVHLFELYKQSITLPKKVIHHHLAVQGQRSHLCFSIHKYSPFSFFSFLNINRIIWSCTLKQQLIGRGNVANAWAEALEQALSTSRDCFCVHTNVLLCPGWVWNHRGERVFCSLVRFVTGIQLSLFPFQRKGWFIFSESPQEHSWNRAKNRSPLIIGFIQRMSSSNTLTAHPPSPTVSFTFFSPLSHLVFYHQAHSVARYVGLAPHVYCAHTEALTHV